MILRRKGESAFGPLKEPWCEALSQLIDAEVPVEPTQLGRSATV